MFYIHNTACISPQQTFSDIDINILHESVDNKLFSREPFNKDIPPNILRRMGKAVRMIVGAALPMIKNISLINGIIIGTSNGGNEECMQFLNQVIDYDEGMLTPLNFVSGTPNAMAAQLGLLINNFEYNITHVHRGLAFEHTIIDVDMLITENPGNTYLFGAVDDISIGNYVVEKKSGSYKKEILSNKNIYKGNSPGSIAGEGAAMFLANGNKANALVKVEGISTLHTEDSEIIKIQLQHFLKKYLPSEEKIDLLLSGENGDGRLLKYYNSCEALINDDITIARFKHMSGEYPTASAMAFWLACNILQNQNVPEHMIKRKADKNFYKRILIYNNYKGFQHSFILISNHNN